MTTQPHNPTLSDQIAQCALNHYHNVIPSNGGKPQRREWTVYAAIVCCRRTINDTTNNHELWVVSCATGSKCTSIRPIVSSFPTQTVIPTKNHGTKRTHSELRNSCDHMICSCYNGMVLKDSHAETLARRGLMAVLWDEVENSLRSIPILRPLLERISDSGSNTTPQFKLCLDISLHLFISDNPCGDASIYEIEKPISNQNTDQPETSVNFTGAKIILSDNNGQSVVQLDESISSFFICSNNADQKHASTLVTVGREDVQHLGALRLKSSRSNIPSHLRSMSMSCSDKIVRWGVLGLQGALLFTFIPHPIVLSSICVSKDPRAASGETDLGQLEALRRALNERIEKTLKSISVPKGWGVKPPEVAVVSSVFERSKSLSDCRLDKRKSEKTDNASNPDTKRERVIKESACGMSINWHKTCNQEALTEITIGATGLKRGKKPKSPKDVVSSASRLSRYQFASHCMICNSLSKTETNVQPEEMSYRKYKQRISSKSLTSVAFSVLCGTSGRGPLVGWVRSGAEEDFDLPHE